MKSGTPLDYAIFQLSPKHSRCELFVSSSGNIEKLASGLVKPFVTHLKVAEEQIALAVQSIRLEVKQCKDVETWFTKGTMERFVRFVSTPEVMELVNTFDTEMSQLEAARRMYSQVAGDQISSARSGNGAAASDATKKELLRAIDVRLGAVRQDLTTASARAAAAGFNHDTVSELKLFADQFGAIQLNEACSKFLSLCDRRSDLINPWKAAVDDAIRASWGSDMSLDEDPSEELQSAAKQPQHHHREIKHLISRQSDATQHLEQSKPSMGQQPLNSSSVSFHVRHSRESSFDRDENKEIHKGGEEEKKVDAVNQNESSQTPQLTRRLSVQDRISLFENKQKENSGSGGKPVGGRSAELRRLSSDVSTVPNSVEKAVLRRWSGASDMSIDLGVEKKDIESPLCTPTSSLVSQTKLEEQKALNDTSTSENSELKSILSRVSDNGLKHQIDPQIRVRVASGQEAVIERKVVLDSGIPSVVSSCMSEVASESSKFASTLATVGSVGGKDHGKTQTQTQTQSRSNFYRVEDYYLEEKVKSENQSRSLSGGKQERSGLTDKGRSKGYFAGDEHGGIKMQSASETQLDGEKGRAVTLNHLRVESRGQRVFHSMEPHRIAVNSGQLAVSGVELRKASATRYKGIECDSLVSYPQGRSFGEVEVGIKDLGSFEKEPVNTMTRAEDTGLQRINFQEQVAPLELTKQSEARRELKNPDFRNNGPGFSGKKNLGGQEDFGAVSTIPGERFPRVRHPKGNQELNDELKMKANELEKLFAEHKSSSARKNKSADMQVEQAASLSHRKLPEEIVPEQMTDKKTTTTCLREPGNMSNFSATPPMKMLDTQNDGDSLKQNFSGGLSDDSRGKFYEIYMQRRDAKLREDWGSRREEKEAKMKAMQDRFERSREEIKDSFSGSVDRQNSAACSAHRRAERLRSFSTRSNGKREKHPIDLLQSEDDEDLSEFVEEETFGHERSLSETSLGDIASKSSHTKKPLFNKNLLYSTPRTSALPAQRSAVKASNSNLGRRKMQTENPLMQSVPNFCDLRKENTKPSPGVSKTTRPQARNYTRSKSTCEEIPVIKEEKTRRSQFLRKSSASPAESSLDPEGIVLTPLKFDKEQTVHNPHDKLPKSVESKPFLRKGNGIGPGAGAVIAKMKFSMASETMNSEEESIEPEESVDAVEDNEEEESEVMITEDHADMDNGKPRQSQESDKFNYGSESGDAVRSFSQVDPSFVAELPAAMGSTFQPAGSVQDSPAESPVSWNSRMHHAFSYANETSDIEASADSPIGSPASWNSHSLNQAEADAAARMRKKWGSAQKPVLVANSSHSQPRKDVTRGFKRLLKFGRKSRGTESLADWISATTSEGDDDTEDGRDPANRSSEDLRKSRMGFSQGHPSDDSFNEREFYSEQVQALYSSIPTPPSNFKLRDDHLSGSSVKVPRSFFSLSSFRSKGNDSKPR